VLFRSRDGVGASGAYSEQGGFQRAAVKETPVLESVFSSISSSKFLVKLEKLEKKGNLLKALMME
jgi:hypothetical protein